MRRRRPIYEVRDRLRIQIAVGEQAVYTGWLSKSKPRCPDCPEISINCSVDLILLGTLFISCQMSIRNFCFSMCIWQPGSLPSSVFDRVGVLRELLCVRYGYCSQALLGNEEMDFIVKFYVGSNVYTVLRFSALLCTFVQFSN